MPNPLERRTFIAGLLALPIVGCETLDAQTLDDLLRASTGAGLSNASLTQADAAQGIRQALANGVVSAIGKVGIVGGYLNDGTIRIPLPQNLQKVQSVLSQFGAGGLLSDLETQLNRGAEKAAPFAKNIFTDVISNLSITDAINIVRGPDTAATQYLSAKTTPRLMTLFSPVMERALADTGALQLVDELSGQLRSIPFAQNLGSNAKSDLVNHGVSKGLGGLFHYIGEQEASIRANPAQRTSEILRRVFGA